MIKINSEKNANREKARRQDNRPVNRIVRRGTSTRQVDLSSIVVVLVQQQHRISISGWVYLDQI